MILDKDTHPERQIYYLGGIVLKMIQSTPSNDIDFFDAFQQLKENNHISINLFILTLDWLFMIDAITSSGGRIKICS